MSEFDAIASVGVLPGLDYPQSIGLLAILLNKLLPLGILLRFNMIRPWNHTKRILLHNIRIIRKQPLKQIFLRPNDIVIGYMISDYSWLVLCLKGHFIPVGVYVLLNLLGFVFGEEFGVELEGL